MSSGGTFLEIGTDKGPDKNTEKEAHLTIATEEAKKKKDGEDPTPHQIHLNPNK